MGARYIEYEAKKILNRYSEPDKDWFWSSYSAKPYIGCEHGCLYCYARSSRYLQHQNPEEYSKVLKVKVNAPSLLKKELKGKVKGVITVGDWQPAEEQYQLSRKMLEIVRDNNFPVHIIERSDLLLRDIDILKEISQISWACVSYSFSTADDALAKVLEPCAPSPTRRFKAIRRLADEEILCGAAYMPIVPYITDNRAQIEQVINKAKEAGASYVLPASMTLNDTQKDYWFTFLERQYPLLIEKYKKLYGTRHYPSKSYQDRIMLAVKKVCTEAQMPMRVPKPEFEIDTTKQADLFSY